jgi:hypothetical protein
VAQEKGNNEDKSQNKFWDFVFHKTRDKVRVHGLGVTRMPVLSRYPFYSVDSSTWLDAGMYGAPTTQEVVYDKNFINWYKKEVHYANRVKWDIRMIMQREIDLTKLWKNRGIDWSNSWTPKPPSV